MRLLQLTSSPSPVSLTEVKTHLRIDGADLDPVLTPLIAAATNFVEAETRQQLSPATFRLLLDEFPEDGITLPKPPLVSVQAIRFMEGGGLDVLESFRYAADPSGSRPGRVGLQPGEAWPVADDVPSAVQVDFIAGYPSAADVPPALRTCIAMLAGHWLEHPEAAVDRRIDEVPMAVQSIIYQHSFPGVD